MKTKIIITEKPNVLTIRIMSIFYYIKDRGRVKVNNYEAWGNFTMYIL